MNPGALGAGNGVGGRGLLLAVALSACACGSRPAASAEARDAVVAAQAPPAPKAAQQDLAPVADFPVIPSSRERERCPDDVLPRGSAETTLQIRVHDVRRDRRELMPLDLSLALQSKPRGGERPRYVADLLIEVYSNPKLFRRRNAPRSEWAAGKLEGRLVIRDTRERRALCQVPLRVRGNAADAPISRRLREMTRASLEHKLYRAVNHELRVALGGISGVLTLAEPGSADERLALRQ